MYRSDYPLLLIAGLCLCISCSLFAGWAHAQSDEDSLPHPVVSGAPSLRFENLDLEDGLAQRSVNAIMQDSQGFLWVGTQGGLHRYDGHSFELFAPAPFDTTSLSSGDIYAIAEAENGDLWIATGGGGLNRLDPATGRAVHYRHDPDDSTSLADDRLNSVLVSTNGDVWVSSSSSGLSRMRADEEGRFQHYRHDPDDPATISSDVVTYVRQDNAGYVWVGTNNGVSRIDPRTDQTTRFLHDPEDAPTVAGPRTVGKPYFPPGTRNIAWLPTANGLVRLDTATGEHERFLVEPGDDVNLYNRLYEVVGDPDDAAVLWGTGPSVGLVRFDTRTETFTTYRRDPRDPHSLSDNYGQTLLADRTGIMWVGTASGGLNAFNPKSADFVHLRHDPDDAQSLAPGAVFGLYEDQFGTLWVGTQESQGVDFLTSFDAETGYVTRYAHDPEDPATLQLGHVSTFVEDASGYLWVAHFYPGGGLSRIDRRTGRVTRFGHEHTPKNARRNAIHALQQASSDPDVLWVGSVGGLHQFDTRTGAFEHISLRNEEGAEQPTVLSLHEDADGTLWVGTRNSGLFRVQDGDAQLAAAHDSRNMTTISSNRITDIWERDAEPGVLWLATSGGGLVRFHTRSSEARHYLAQHGLANNVLYGILEDERGALWISTNAGISNFDPETETFRNYGLDDGLMDLEYNQNAYATGAGGVLYFGSAEGVTAFSPANLSKNETPPQVAITQFRLFNAPVVPGPDSPLTEALARTKRIALAHDKNEVTFEFAALHYGNPSKNKYAYRLEGYDKEWIETNAAHRTASYTNLPPGDYRFRVKAANSDGVWNETGASLALAILPPWWGTWWAYLLYGVLLVAGFFSVDRFQRRRLLRKERERTRQLEERRRELEKLVEQRTAELKQRVEELSVINSVQRGLVAELEMQAIYDLVGDRIRELFDAQVVVIRTYDHDEGTEHFRYIIEKGQRLYPPARPIDGFIRHVIDRQSPLLINEGFTEYVETCSGEVVAEGEVPKSALFVPMIVGDEVRGNVSLQNVDREQAFSESDVRLLSTLTNSMSVALENARLFDETTRLLTETEQRNAELAVINSVQEGLVAELDMQAIYDLVGERIRDLFDAQVLVIATVDHEAGLEHHRYNIEKGSRRYPDPRPLDLLRKRLIDERAVIHIQKDLKEALEKMGIERPEPVPGTEMPKSVLFVPLAVGDEVRGYVSLQNVDREHAFSDSDVRLLTTLTNSMSVALENARLFDETRQQAIELETVNRVSRALVAQLEFDALVRLVGDQMRETFGADIVYLALLDRESNMINFPYVYGEELAPIAFGEGLTSQIIQTREPLLINHDLHGRYQELGIEHIGKQAASYLGVPILAGEKALGVISVQSTEKENRFAEDDLRLLSTIAANVGVALGNAEAYRALEKTLGELKATQQQLVQQEKLASLGQLTAGIAHEIKNPLNFITGFAEVNEELAEELRQDLGEYPEALQHVEDLLVDLRQNAGVIKQHGRRADAIVRSMMAHARTGSGEWESVSFNDLIDEHVELAYHGKRAQVPGFPAQIERDYADGVGEIELVPQEIGRVVLNLVANAFDAVAEHAVGQNGEYVPQVRISTRRTGREVEVRIEDNGPGISEEVRHRIFEPFFTTKAAGSGTGLGLSMSYDIITQSHGGTLEVEEAENGGAAFVVRLPTTKRATANE